MNCEECPKFSRCMAPICPLDSQKYESAMLQGERVCYFLREIVKPGAKQRFFFFGYGHIFTEILPEVNPLARKHLELKRQLLKAKTTPPIMSDPFSNTRSSFN